jgi:hypothetical protein
MLNDPSLDGATIIVDALDEYRNRDRLLNFITEPCCVK